MEESVPGKVDEKATQLHAIASLKVLLDATKPQRGAATSSAANHVKVNLKETSLGRPNGNIDATLDSVSHKSVRLALADCACIGILIKIAMNFHFNPCSGPRRRRARSSQYGVAVRDEGPHHILAGGTNHLSTMVNTPRHTNASRKEILSHHIHRLHPVDCCVLISHGVVGECSRRHSRNST